MKFNYRIILLALLVAAVFMPAIKVQAQSNELLVEWQASDGTVATNALQSAIANDTERPAGRVYKLQKGGFYWLTETIQNNGWALRIEGEAPDANDPFGNPAVIQMVARGDATVSGKILQGGGDVTLKNLYIVGADNNGVQTYYQPVEMTGNNYRYIFDNCIFERTNFACIAVSGKDNDIFITNCKFRNVIGQPSTQQWEGRGISIWADQDSVVVENCTFFNLGMTALQIEGGAANYVRFNHNTLVNVGRAINTGNWWREAYFANNLLVNGFFHGEGFADYDLGRNPTRESQTTGHFSVGALPGKYGPEEGRRVVFTKVAAYLDPAFTTYYGDTIRTQPYINEITASRFINKYDAMVVSDTLKLSAKPDFPVYPSDIITSMINNIKDLRAGVTPATPYFWMLPTDPVAPSWPLPENFSYTTAQLLSYGTNNMPLGDLNWLPGKKAEWELIKEKDYADIKALAGAVVTYNVVDQVEAEKGTLSGNAAVKDVDGFAYFKMDSGGFIEWKFNLDAAGEYDLNVWTHLRGNATRGQRIIVNGVSIHDPMGWGEYIWSPTEQAANIWYGKISNNEWVWTLIKQAEINEAGALSLIAGENTIRIESSWGYQNFAGIDVMQGGVVKKSLRPAGSTFDIVQLIVEGAVWTPSGLQSVGLGTGSCSVALNAPTAGKYKIQVLFQNAGTSDLSAQVKVDGTVAIASLPLAADEKGGVILSSEVFNLTQGNHTVEISGADFNLDVIKLVEVISSGVKKDELPDGYALEQNYPNPFNPSTTINFSIGKSSNVKLIVYNILGQKVTTLVDNFMNAGSYAVQFNASRLSSGVYFYSIESGDFRINKKMMLLK